MFLQIVGWLFLVGFAFWVSSAWFVVAIFGLGKYNIGGVPNKWSKKIFLIIFGLMMVYNWYFIFSIAPFSISTNV